MNTLRLKVWLRKALRFAAFSASTLVGTAVDTAVLWVFAHMVLKDFLIAGYHVGVNYVAPTISFVCATVANFAMAYFFIWRDRITERTVRSFFRHYVGYFGSCIFGFVVKMCFLELFLMLLGWDVVICNLIALCFSGCVNFAMNEWVVFRTKKKLPPQIEAEEALAKSEMDNATEAS